MFQAQGGGAQVGIAAWPGGVRFRVVISKCCLRLIGTIIVFENAQSIPKITIILGEILKRSKKKNYF